MSCRMLVAEGGSHRQRQGWCHQLSRGQESAQTTPEPLSRPTVRGHYLGIFLNLILKFVHVSRLKKTAISVLVVS